MPRGRNCAPRSRAAPAGAARSSATPIASTRCSGSCSPTRGAVRRPGRRLRARRLRPPPALPALRHRPARALRRPIGAADERFLRGFLNPLWDLGLVVGHQVRELDEFAQLEADNPEFLLALLDARPVAGDARAVRAVRRGVSPGRRRTRSSCESLLAADRRAARAVQRHALPARARREGSARRAARSVGDADDRAADRSGAAAARARRSGARSTRPRISCCASARSCTSRRRRNQNVLSHELQETDGRACSATRAPQPRQRVERLMSDYFRHARDRRPRRSSGRARPRPCPVGPNLGAVARRHPLRRSGAGRRAARRPGSRAFQAALDAGCDGRPTRRCRCIQQHVDRFRADDFFPTPRAARRAAAVPEAAAGLYARLSEMHDCGLLGRMFPEFQAITCRVVRDFYHKYTVDEHTLLTIRNLERLVDDRRARARALRVAARRAGGARAARARAALSRRRQVARRRPRTSRACGWREQHVRAAAARRRGARRSSSS